MTKPSMPNIDLNPHDWTEVKRILERYVPQYYVWVFGSRATWKAKAYSDLDLAVITDTKFSLATLAHLQSAFDESDLSIKVDVVDWAATGEAFREIIRKTAVIVQKAQKIVDATKPSDMKMTNYGAFAADYAVERLASLCVPVSGVQTGPFGSQLHQEDYVAVGTPIITVEHLGDNRIIHQDLPRVSDKDRDRLSKYHLREGDIVFSRVGSVDRRSLVRREEDGWLFSGRCLRVRPDNHKIDSTYLSYFFGLPAFKEHIRSIAVGATMPSLNTQLLSGIFVPHPKDLREQRAIGNILGTLDDKIELNRRMNETLEAMARALFKSWFVDFEPVRAKSEGIDTGLPKEIADLFPDSFEDSELGEVPKGWRVGTVDEDFNLTMGQSPPGDTYNVAQVGLPFYQGRADFGFRFPSQRVFCTAPTRFAEAGDTLISVRAPVGDINMASEHCCIGRGVATARHKSGSRSYTYYFMQSIEEVFSRFEAEGTVFGSISKKDFHNIRRIMPPVSVVNAFEQFAAPIDERITVNERESRTLAAQRDALLPKLLSGEVRVKELVNRLSEESL